MAIQVGAAPPTGGSDWSDAQCHTFLQVEEGTAKVGGDFSHSSAGLVQFDPGESDVSPPSGQRPAWFHQETRLIWSWCTQIFLWPLEENDHFFSSETFSVLLSLQQLIVGLPVFIVGLPVFCPGVKVKTWSIFLVNDGLEENHETFTVILKNPRNAILGQQTSARVEIIDPRGGATFPHDPAPPKTFSDGDCLLGNQKSHEFHLCQDAVTWTT